MHGRPFLGAISGFFLGIFLALGLMLWGIWPLDRWTVFGLPILFLLIGLLGAIWAPFGRRKARERMAASAPTAVTASDVAQPPPMDDEE